jgi:hypothetical protein
MAETGTRRVTGGRTDTGRELSKIGAGCLLSIGCNVLAPYATPVWGVICVVTGIGLYLLSFREAASLRGQVKKHPLGAVVVGLLLAGILALTVQRSFTAVKRVLPSRQQSGCPSTGPATANGPGSIANSGCNNKDFHTGQSQ